MAGTAFGLPEIASLYDPSVAVDEAQIQRQMQLAQALRQMSLQAHGQTQMAGNVAIRNSPLEGVAQALQAYKANQLDQQNDSSRLALNTRMAQAMAQALRGDQPQQAPAPVSDASSSVPGSPAPSPASAAPAAAISGNGPSMAALLRGSLVNSIGGPAMGSAYAKQFEPTDMERQLNAAGITDPTMRHQLIQASIAKGNYIAPVNGRPGGWTQDPHTGQWTNLPVVPPGFQGSMSPNGQVAVNPVQGGLQALQQSTAAGAIGKASGEVYDKGVGPDGQPKPVTSVASVLGYGPPPANGPAVVPPDVQARRDVDRRGILTDELARTTDPFDRANLQKQLDALKGGTAFIPPSNATYGAAPLGTPEAQTRLSKAWGDQLEANRQAQTTKSYLQNIVQAAQNGAIVGPGADRREMIQGLFQLAGINDKVNENAVDQTKLLKKYHANIVTRLGTGGLGTDAARSMLDAAYPGHDMNVGAIKEAAANLGGVQDLIQAKTRVLKDAGIKADTNAYQQKEIAFDQAADPRIWQYKSIQDPNARRAFAAALVKQDPSIPQRIKALEAMGAL